MSGYVYAVYVDIGLWLVVVYLMYKDGIHRRKIKTLEERGL